MDVFESTTYSHEEWTQKFGAVPHSGASRAVKAMQCDFDVQELSTGLRKHKVIGAQSEPSVEDISHLVRYVVLLTLNTQEVFNSILAFIKNGPKNYKANDETKTIIGYIFEGSRSVEYKLGLFRHNGQLILNLDVLQGDRFAINGLWNNLEKFLEEEGYIESQLEEDDDLDIEFSDDESDLPCFLGQPNYLQFPQNPACAKMLVEDVSNPNPSFILETLLIIAHNVQLAENFRVLQRFAQALFDSMIICLGLAAQLPNGNCLPVARCAAMIIAKLVEEYESNKFTVNKDQYQVIVNTLTSWSGFNGSRDLSEDVTESEEIANLLSRQLPKLAAIALGETEIAFDTLKGVCAQTEFEGLKDNIGSLLKAC